MRPSPEPSLEALGRGLLDRCLRAILHRLRGIRTVLNGWLLMGLPDCEKLAVQRLMEEEQGLLDRLDRIRALLHEGPSVETLARGELPAIALAASFSLGTPEHGRERVPVPRDPVAGIALALWLEAQAGGSMTPLAPPPAWRIEEGRLRVELPGGAPSPVAWRARFPDLVVGEPAPGCVVFAGGLFGAAEGDYPESSSSADEAGESSVRSMNSGRGGEGQ